MIPLADNCSGLSDCSFEIKVALAVVAIVLVLALFAMLGPTLGVAVRGALAIGRSGGLRGLLRFGARLPRGARVSVPRDVLGKLPRGWGRGQLTKKGGGVRWSDPVAKRGSGVRIDRGDPSSPFPSQRVDHVIVRDGGKVLGRDGTPIRGSIKQDPENAHIPLDVYRTWRTWNAP